MGRASAVAGRQQQADCSSMAGSRMQIAVIRPFAFGMLCYAAADAAVLCSAAPPTIAALAGASERHRLH